MKRTPQWESVEMAVGDARPAWPLPGVVPRFALWSFGGVRPFGCSGQACVRWHAGIDLVGAKEGALVVSPEDATVINVDRNWSAGSKAVDLRTKSGLFIVLGGFAKGSPAEFGIVSGAEVRKGQELGRVLGSYGMIHMETYHAADRTKNSPWRRDKGPPKGILNPTNYTERMVGDRLSLLRTVQRQTALRALGYLDEVDPTWGEKSKAALAAAQRDLGVKVDGVWGRVTEDRILEALAGNGRPITCDQRACRPVDSRSASPVFWAVAASMGVIGLIAGAVVLGRRYST